MMQKPLATGNFSVAVFILELCSEGFADIITLDKYENR